MSTIDEFDVAAPMEYYASGHRVTTCAFDAGITQEPCTCWHAKGAGPFPKADFVDCEWSNGFERGLLFWRNATTKVWL